MFGYDFMVDSDFSVWLIEANCNPCLDESSKDMSKIKTFEMIKYVVKIINTLFV